MKEIFHRISVRKYEDRPVEKEKILEIIRAGMQAPSAANQQPWEFYVITDREILTRLGSREVSPFTRMTRKAPVAIVTAYRTDGPVPEMAEIDMAISLENMWLMADSLGLGGVMLGIAPAKARMDAVREIVGIPDHLQPFTIFPFGYPAEDRPQEDRFDETRIHYL